MITKTLKLKPLHLLCPLLAALLFTASVSAEAGDSKGAMNADRAAAIARKSTGGRVLGVKRSKRGYEVRVLVPGGKVRTVHVANKRR